MDGSRGATGRAGASTEGWVIHFELTVILLLIVFNGLFAGAEIAMLSLRRSRVQELKRGKRSRLAALERLQANPERFLATVQVGITVVSVAASGFAGDRLTRDLEPLLARLPWIGTYADQAALALVVALVSYLSLVLGELVPKSLGLHYAERYAVISSRPIWWLSLAAKPVVSILTASSNLVLRLFGVRSSFTESRLSVGEVRRIVDDAAKTGTVDPHAGEIAVRALEFGDLLVSDVMVPRTKVTAISRTASEDELRRLVLESGHSRYPVYDGSIDNVVGYILTKDLISIAWEGRLFVLDDLLRPAHLVPEMLAAADLLRDMQARGLALVVVVEESGGMAGIVTMEDLVEELVGEIVGEYDEPVPESVKRQADGSFVVRAATPVREVRRATALPLPEVEGATTIAGLCIHLAGEIPQRGRRLRVPGGVLLEVLEATASRVQMVRVAGEKNDEE